MLRGTLQGALLGATEHGGVDGDLHPPFAAQPHPVLLAHHFAFVFIWGGQKKLINNLKKGLGPSLICYFSPL